MIVVLRLPISVDRYNVLVQLPLSMPIKEQHIASASVTLGDGEGIAVSTGISCCLEIHQIAHRVFAERITRHLVAAENFRRGTFQDFDFVLYVGKEKVQPHCRSGTRRDDPRPGRRA